KEFERGISFEETRPLSPEGRTRWKRAKKGRPRIGKGCKIIAASIERGLLERARAYGRRHGLNTSQVISRGLESLVGIPGGAGHGAGAASFAGPAAMRRRKTA